MPQPLPKVKRHASFVISSSLGTDRPILAPYIVDVIATWASVEVWLGSCLARVLGASAETGIAMFTALNSGTAQRDVIRAVARSELKGDDLTLFLAVLNVALDTAKPRNIIAHGVWALSPQIPEGVLLIPPRTYLDWQGKEVAGKGEGHIDTSTVLVYKEKDFQEIVQRIITARNNLQLLWMYLDQRATPKLRERSRTQLMGQPQIQENIRRQKDNSPRSSASPG